MPRLRGPQPVSTVTVPDSERGRTKQTLKKAIRDETATAKLIRTVTASRILSPLVKNPQGAPLSMSRNVTRSGRHYLPFVFWSAP
jgi:hypothetical protein